jgi:trehalose/maltose hydrolase-like predicted phosphorylase
MAPKSKANAVSYGGEGNLYPWESGTSGADVSNDTCPSDIPQCHLNRLFVTAGVSYAIRMYYSATRDRDYMITPIYSGCDVSRDIAKFLAYQAIYNPETARYDISGNIPLFFLLLRKICFCLNGGNL